MEYRYIEDRYRAFHCVDQLIAIEVTYYDRHVLLRNSNCALRVTIAIPKWTIVVADAK